MKMLIADFPKHPLPPIPQPQAPQQSRVQPPTVFVYERQQWEYHVVTKHVADKSIVAEDEFNALGKAGWELVAVMPVQQKVQFLFKRVKA
jgi:hypothetical protein